MIQEFQISVTPLEKNQYLVRTENVAQGVPSAEEKVDWPTEDWWAQTQQLMNDPLLSLLEDNRSFADDFLLLTTNSGDNLTHSSPSNLVELGKKLYDALFQGSLRDSWITAQGVAKHQRSILRLRLGLKDIHTARLPWEVLHAGGGSSYSTSFRPLATGIDVAFSRYQPNTPQMHPASAPVIANHQPLKILMVLAGPDDQESLELKKEAKHLQEELSRNYSNSPNQIELIILEQPGREQLTQALEQGKYQVFHYAGHSNLGASGGNIYLVSSQTGLTEKVSGNDLAGLLVNNGVQLAVFNSCRGANATFTPEGNSIEGGSLAQALVKRGVPAVLAMAEKIPDEVALTLTRLLYRNINQGHPIDISLNRARQGLISAYGSHQLYWALPVLYLHPKFDGLLINPNDEENAAYISTVLGQYTPTETMKAPVIEPITGDLEAQMNYTEELDDELAAAFIKNVLDEYGEQESSQTKVVQLSVASPESEIEDAEDDEQTAAFIRDVLNEFSDPETALVPVSESQSGQITTVQRESLPHQDFTTSSSPGNLLSSSPEHTETTESNPQNHPNQDLESPQKRKLQLPKWVGLVSIASIATVIGLGFWLLPNHKSNLQDWLAVNSTPAPSLRGNSSSVDLAKLDTPTLTGRAIEAFSQGRRDIGVQAVEELLDRNSLPLAKTALASVPTSQLEEATISFLRGKLAWQSVLAGDSNYSLDDARRYWETAVKKKPQSIIFYNALGFAYYAEGEFNQANQAWYNVLELAEEQEIATAGEIMNTYAGLALGLAQLAQGKSALQKRTLLNQALKLRQKVMSAQPESFQPDALAQNWLWSQQAINDWQILIQKN